MLRSKSFELEKPKRIKTRRCNNPGSHLSKVLTLVVLAGFISWFILANIPENETSNTSTRSSREFEPKNEIKDNKLCIVSICDVICDSGDIDDVSSFMQAQSGKLCGYATTLTLLNITFPDSALKENWLTGSFTLLKLFIKNSELEVIEEGAFEGGVFRRLTDLEISYASINYLEKGSFSDLSSLMNLKLDHSVNEFSPEYLDGVENNIKKIEIHGITDLRAANELFGSLPLPQLLTLELGDNNFGDTITETTFQNATPSTSLNLTGCKISSLHPRSFALNQKRPSFLYLQNNNLTEVSGEVFEPFIGSYQFSRISLSENPWNCTSGLLSLVNLIGENEAVFNDSPKCASPPELAGKELNPDIFSTTSTTTTTEQPTSSTPSTTGTTTTTTEVPTSKTTTTTMLPVSTSTKDPDGSSQTEIVCEDSVEDICTSGPCDGRSILRVGEMDAKFNISKVSSGAVRISIERPAADFSIVWFSPATKDLDKVENHYTEHNLGCIELEMQNFTIQNLELGAVYTFCVVKNNEPEMTPLNCQSHWVEVDCNEADSLDPESKTALLLLSVISILVAVFLGAVTMFCAIRCNPSLLKGSKRVVVLSENTPEVMVLLKGRSKLDEMNFIKRDITSKRMSIDSTGSGQDYIIPDYEVISNLLSTTQRKDSLYFQRLPFHSPPPLPKRLSEESVPKMAVQRGKLQFVTNSSNEYAVANSLV